MIIDAPSARERVRLILDRANSPWLTNSEIDNFIEMAINEYLRERVNKFGATQQLRDDFGGFVKSVVFTAEPVDENVENNVMEGHVFRRQFLEYDESGNNTLGLDAYEAVPGGEWNVIGCEIKDRMDDGETDTDEIHFGYLLDIKVKIGGGIRKVKVQSLDRVLRVQDDPFHAPDTNDFHAFRINDIYYIKPSPSSNNIVTFTYVSNDNRVDNIGQLPNHGREEVCQIAARKILGTVADERLPVALNEIRQLEGK